MKISRLYFVFVLFLISTIIAVAEQYSVTAETLNVRQRASSKSEVLFKLSKEDIVESNDHGKWMEIDHNGQRGYAYSKYLKKVDSGVSSFYNDDSISWLPIIWMTLPLVIFIAILFWLHKYYRWSSLFYASIGSLIVIVIVPPLIKFLFGLFDHETIGKYVGWGLTALIVYGTFAESTKKAEKKTSNTSLKDHDNCQAPSSLDSEDFSPRNWGNGNIVDNDDNDSNFGRHDDDYDRYERELQEREESERRRDQYDRYMREAEEAYRQYDYYKSKAEDAKSSAETYIRSAESHEQYAKDLDDEGHYREAQSDKSMAESYYRDARQYMSEANSYYNDYQRAKQEAESYR